MYGIYREFISITCILIINMSVLRQVRSPLQTDLSLEYDLMLPLPISFIFTQNQCHPVAAYVFFLVFPSLISSLIPFLQ